MEDDLLRKGVDYNKEYMNFVKTAAHDMDKFTLDLLALAKAGHEDGNKESISTISILERIKISLELSELYLTL